MFASLAGVLFDGFAYGMLLFLLSVGLSVTLGMMNFVNLAHCSFAMVGAYATFSLASKHGWPFLATLPMAFVAAAAISLVLERTRFGAQVRAAVDNQRMARGLGIDVDRAFMFTFALGGGLAGLGGALSIQMVGLDPTFALGYLVYVLIVVAVGGLGSIGGSFAAAVVLGISDMAGKYYFPWLGAFLIYLVMVALLMWRPAGLFGKR